MKTIIKNCGKNTNLYVLLIDGKRVTSACAIDKFGSKHRLNCNGLFLSENGVLDFVEEHSFIDSKGKRIARDRITVALFSLNPAKSKIIYNV